MSLLFINAQILGPDGVIASSLRVDRDRIAALDAKPGRKDVVFDLGGSIVSPGLINAHDHLQLNNFGRLKWRDRYANASEWIADFNARFGSDPQLDVPKAVPLQDRLFIGRLKNILAGVTTVCHHDPLFRSLRRRFPNRVVTRYGWSHSFFLESEVSIVREFRRTPDDWPWIIHLAEGTDESAAREFAQLDRLGCVCSNTIAVHGVGLCPNDQTQLIDRGGGLIWCPSSNLFLLGETIDVGNLIRARKVALGSDSRLSGERDLLDEIHVAAEILAKGSVSNDGSQVQPSQDLFRMVTIDAAKMLCLPQLGRIEIGRAADLVVLPAVDSDPFASLIHSRRSDVRLVMFEGRPVIGDPDFEKVFLASRARFDRARLDDREKWIDRSIARRLKRSIVQEVGLEIRSI